MSLTTLTDAALRLKHLKRHKEDLDKELKKVKAEIADLEENVIPDALEEMGVADIRLHGVGKIGIRSEMRAGIRAGMRELANDWLRANGHGGVITETVNVSSLKSLAKSQFVEGDPLPDEIFYTHPYSKAVVYK